MARYGSGAGGDFNDEIRRAQEGSAASDMARKERERAAAEERSAGAERASIGARGDVAGATRELTTALSENITRLATETSTVEANTRAWRANAVARAEAAGGGVGRTPRAAREAPAAAAAAVAADPGAGARYASALAAQNAAEARVKAAQSAYAGALRPTSGVPPGEQVSLLAQQEEAKRGVQAARAETAAAQKNVEAQQQLTRQREQASAELAKINAALGAELAAQQRAVAQRVEQSARAVSGVTPLQLGAGAIPPQRRQIGEGGLFNLGSGEYGQQQQAVERAARAVSGVAPLQLGAGPTPLQLGAGRPLQLSEEAGTTAAETKAAAAVAAHEERLAKLATQQRTVNAEFQQSVAAYANSSSALSRHGALTTEFIQAFARGQVTLKEFESQMLSTIGKFSGWAVAAGLVYGAFNALKDLGSGAAQTQTGVAQLGRFIPGLGGPAGGGNAQIGAAEGQLRDISTQFNVPIKEVVDSMQIMARVFHNVSDAGDATRAVLAAVKLDQIPQAQATQYLTGISQSLNIQSGKGVEGVVSSLNALQNTLGARVSQTLPALARAAPAAQAGGLDTPTLEALVAVGVRAGITGPQVGTAILRSVGTFAFRPASEQTFKEYGINAQSGQYGNLIRDVSSLIDKRATSGNPLTGDDLKNLAQALGGPLLGTRTLLPILAQEATHPGALAGAVETAKSPPSYQKDLDAVLGTISERFKSLGIALQNLGSFLASSGILSPLIAAFDVFSTVLHAFEALVSPLVSILGVFNQLPGVVKDAIGAFVGFKAATLLYNSTFGSTAQGFVGKLPGLSQLDTQPREAIRGTLGRLQTYALPGAQADEEAADNTLRKAKARQLAAVNNLADYETKNAAAAASSEGTKANAAYWAGRAPLANEVESTTRRASVASDRAIAAGEATATVEGQIAALKDKHASTVQKTAFIAAEGLAVQAEDLDVSKRIIAAKLELLRGMTGVGGAAGSVAGAASTGGRAGAASQVEAAAAAAAGASTVVAAAAKAARTGTTYLSPAEAAAAAAAAPPGRQFIAGPEGVQQVAAPLPPYAGSGAPIQGRLPPEEEAGRLARARTAATGFLGDNAGAAPFAGLLASQLVGSTVGGGVGNYISSVGGTAATGAIIAQMLGKSGAGIAAGAAAGTIAGSFQQSSTAGLASLLGGGLGAGIGAIVGGGVPGALIGGTIGSTLGSVVGGVFGGSAPTPADQQREAEKAAAAERDVSKAGLDAQIKKAQEKLQSDRGGGLLGTVLDVAKFDWLTAPAALAASAVGIGDTSSKQAADKKTIAGLQQARALAGSGTASASAIDAFGVQFSADLETAFTGTGDAATKAQGKIDTQLGFLAAQLKAFGAHSQTGARAAAELDAAAAAAVNDVNTSPDKAGKTIDIAFQARQTDIASQFKYDLASAAPGGAGAAAAASAAARVGAQADVYGKAIAEAQAQADAAQGVLNQALVKGNQATITTARKSLDDFQQKLQQAKDQAGQAGQANTLANQADAAAAYGAQQAVIGASAGAAQAAAGGNKAKQLDAQIAAQSQLNSLAGSSGLSPQASYIDQTNATAKIADLQNQKVQQGLTELKAKQSVATASVPTTDTSAVARQNLKNVEDQYNYIKSHASTFDPADLNTALAAVIAARQTTAQAIKDTATQLNDIRGQIAQAQAAGDAVLQAQIGIQTAANDLASAGNDPKKIAAAQLAAVNAENALHQANQQRIAAAGGLAKSQNPNDAVGNALKDISTAQQTLAHAHGIDEQTAAQQGLNAANNAYEQAVQNRTTAQGALAASKVTDPLAKLQKLIAAAAKNLATAVGPDQITADATTLNGLLDQRHTATLARSAAQAGVRSAGADGNAELQAQINVDHARQVLAAARGTVEQYNAEQGLLTAETQLRKARLARSQALSQLRETQAAGNAVLQAQIALAQAQHQLTVAHGPDEGTAARQAIAAAENQLHQASQARIGALGGLAQSQAQGDSVAIAEIALQTAAAELASARGIDEQIAANSALASAQYQLHQALQGQITALGALAASTTREPLQQLAYQIQAAAEVLSHAVTEQERVSDTTSLNNLRNQYQAAVISQTEGTINFQLQMKEITTQQAIAQLQSLEQTGSLTLQERQQLELQIRQLQLGTSSSSFNLAPGHIKLPTVYDVRRAMQGQSLIAQGGATMITSQPIVNVYVTGSKDVPAVADAIDRAMGGAVQAQLRAAGVV